MGYTVIQQGLRSRIIRDNSNGNTLTDAKAELARHYRQEIAQHQLKVSRYTEKLEKLASASLVTLIPDEAQVWHANITGRHPVLYPEGGERIALKPSEQVMTSFSDRGRRSFRRPGDKSRGGGRRDSTRPVGQKSRGKLNT